MSINRCRTDTKTLAVFVPHKV